MRPGLTADYVAKRRKFSRKSPTKKLPDHIRNYATLLLGHQPEIYNQLREERQVLQAMEHYARELRNLHPAWQETLNRQRPESDPSQIASEALELALKDLGDCLHRGSPLEGQEALSLEQAMAFIRRHTQRGYSIDGPTPGYPSGNLSSCGVG